MNIVQVNKFTLFLLLVHFIVDLYVSSTCTIAHMVGLSNQNTVHKLAIVMTTFSFIFITIVSPPLYYIEIDVSPYLADSFNPSKKYKIIFSRHKR